MNIFTTFFLVLTLFFLVSCNSSRMAYWDASAINSIERYESFLAEYPKSRYKKEVLKRLSELIEKEDYNLVKEENSILKYRNFLQKYPNSQYKESIELSIEEVKKALKEPIIWEEIKNSNDISVYENFLKDYPKTKKGAEIERTIVQLKKESSDEFVVDQVPPSWKGCEIYTNEEAYKCSIEKFNEFLNIEYPIDARANRIEGYIVVRFHVTSKGLIENTKIIRNDIECGTHNAIMEQMKAMSEVRPSLWNPGFQRGFPSKHAMTISLVFSLD